MVNLVPEGLRVRLALFGRIFLMCHTVVRMAGLNIDAGIDELADCAEWALQVKFAYIKRYLCALHAREAKVTKHTLLVSLGILCHVSVPRALMEDMHRRSQDQGEEKEDADEHPEDVRIVDDSEA